MDELVKANPHEEPMALGIVNLDVEHVITFVVLMHWRKLDEPILTRHLARQGVSQRMGEEGEQHEAWTKGKEAQAVNDRMEEEPLHALALVQGHLVRLENEVPKRNGGQEAQEEQILLTWLISCLSWKLSRSEAHTT